MHLLKRIDSLLLTQLSNVVSFKFTLACSSVVALPKILQFVFPLANCSSTSNFWLQNPTKQSSNLSLWEGKLLPGTHCKLCLPSQSLF